MEKEKQFDELKKFPKKILEKFLDILEEKDDVNVIKKQLCDTGIVLEYKNYQISIASLNELIELQKYVETYVVKGS